MSIEDEVYADWLNILGTDEALDHTFAAEWIQADLHLMHDAAQASHGEDR